MIDCDYMLVSLTATGLDNNDKAKCNDGLHTVATQSAAQPSQITAVRDNIPAKRDEEGNITQVPHLWLMSGEFSIYSWWGNEQEMKQVCADGLIAAGVKEVPAVVNTINVVIKTQSQIDTMLYDDALAWEERT